MEIEVHRFDAAREADFDALHCDEHGTGWCRCVAWWVPTWDGWGERTAEQNRALRSELCRRGDHDGYLLYVNGEPAAWCQCGRRDRLEKLCRQYALEPDETVWAITCFLVAPEHRGHGLATALLGAVLEDLRDAGVRRVEGFPRRGGALDASDLWTGPEAIFRAHGFRVVTDDDEQPVLALRLDAPRRSE